MRTYSEYKEMLEEKLTDLLPVPSKEADILGQAMKYSLSAGGKRIRPVLFLACAELCGLPAEKALPYACAIEYIQTYSLIHDDLPAMDNDDLRRGKPTNHVIFGAGMATLAGDGLLSAAYELILKDMRDETDDSILRRKAQAAYLIARGTGSRGMVAGQAADISSENLPASEDMLLYIHRHKTADFLSCSVLAGAALGGAAGRLLADLSSYAENMGLAFQVVDDIMDVIGTKQERGKKVGGDVQLGKLTYVSVYGLDRSVSIAQDLLAKAQSALDPYPNAYALQYVLDLLSDQIRR